MLIREIINSADEMRNNDISEIQKIKWLSELDESLFEEIVLTHESEELLSVRDGGEPEFRVFPYKEDTVSLIAPNRFRPMYEHFLCAKIDYCQNEIERFENDSALFNSSFNKFKAWYNENHLPLIKASINTKASFLRGGK